MVGTWTHGRNRSVECDQLYSTSSCQMQQRGVRHLPEADDFGHQFVEWGCGKRWCNVCILMMRMGDKTAEQMDSGLAIKRYAHNLWIQREVQKAGLRQQAGGPPRGRLASKQ
jgi:hypothetical protein